MSCRDATGDTFNSSVTFNSSATSNSGVTINSGVIFNFGIIRRARSGADSSQQHAWR